MARRIEYKGVQFVVHEQSFFVPPGQTYWLERPITERDIDMVKSLIDAGRNSMAREVKSLCDQLKRLGAT